jgi:hypothetical protein
VGGPEGRHGVPEGLGENRRLEIPAGGRLAIEGLDMTALGMYQVDGDTWKHCFALGNRPTEFGSKEGSGVTYIVLKRVKK